MINLLFIGQSRMTKVVWFAVMAFVLSAILLFFVYVNSNYEGTFIDLRDKSVYRIVKIGSRTWMAENLNYADSSNNIGTCYDNDSSKCGTFGRLYSWAEAMGLPASCDTSLCAEQVHGKYQGICPDGWYVPSDVEWTSLTDVVGSNAGTKLRSKIGWNTDGAYGPRTRGTDKYGFSALPSGLTWSRKRGEASGLGWRTFWWSTTEGNADYAWGRGIDDDSSHVYRRHLAKIVRYSVRCVQAPLGCDGNQNERCNGADTHTHRYGSWEVTTPATCGAPGVESRICRCGDTEIRSIAQLLGSQCATWGDRDRSFTYSNQVYHTVRIGDLTWMAQNLNYETAGSWCYDNSADSCAKYGRLYTWTAAMGACPDGWRLPDTSDWNNLVTAVGGQRYSTDVPGFGTVVRFYSWTVAGRKLKSVSSVPYAGADDLGFSALPGGVRGGYGDFDGAGEFGCWWCSTTGRPGFAHERRMVWRLDDVLEGIVGISGGNSVRCVQN